MGSAVTITPDAPAVTITPDATPVAQSQPNPSFADVMGAVSQEQQREAELQTTPGGKQAIMAEAPYVLAAPAMTLLPELAAEAIPGTIAGSSLLGATAQGAAAGAVASGVPTAIAEPFKGENPFSFEGAKDIAESTAAGAAFGGGTGAILDSLSSVAPKRLMTWLARRGVDLDAAPAAAQYNPALNNTPRQVAQQADRLGVDLTPAQFSEHPMARITQGIGERSMFGSRELVQEMDKNAGALVKGVGDFMNEVDPHGLGMNEQTAGESIQQAAKTAMSVRQENVANAYKQAGIDQADLAGDLSNLKDFAQQKLMVRQPHAALTRPEYQSPAVAAALQDIADAPDRVGKSPSIQSMRNLRTEFMDKANDFSGNIPDAARAIYKQAAGITDNAIMDAAHGTPFEKSFRDASSQWKNLQQLYNEPGTPLYRILQQKDPVAVTRGILNRQSPTDIATLQNEHMDGALEALRSQVIRDVVNARFRASPGGLGGYSNEFLQSLFQPAQLKELYLDADIGRRFNFQINPSGTGSIMMGETQILHPEPSKLGLAYGAAQASMPNPARMYIGPEIPRIRLVNGTKLPSILAAQAPKALPSGNQ